MKDIGKDINTRPEIVEMLRKASEDINQNRTMAVRTTGTMI